LGTAGAGPSGRGQVFEGLGIRVEELRLGLRILTLEEGLGFPVLGHSLDPSETGLTGLGTSRVEGMVQAEVSSLEPATVQDLRPTEARDFSSSSDHHTACSLLLGSIFSFLSPP
jgi:hypothetical protein